MRSAPAEPTCVSAEAEAEAESESEAEAEAEVGSRASRTAGDSVRTPPARDTAADRDRDTAARDNESIVARARVECAVWSRS